MKNKFLPLMMLLCFTCLGVARAEVVTIGSGDGTSSYLPTYSYYNYSLTQQIYTADEIGRAGTIGSIAFKNMGTEKTRTIEIYFVHTSKTSFSSTTDWITVENSDRVFFGGVTFTAGEWTTIILDTPFEYDGTSNLAVIVDDETGSWSSGLSCAAFDATGMALRVYSDGTDYNPYTPTLYTGTIENKKNQIKLDFPTCLPPTNVHVQEGSLTYNGVTMEWDAEEGVSYQEFMQKTTSFNPDNMPWSWPWEGEGSMTWDNLSPDTDYTFGVRKYCSDDDQSTPVLMSIHTPPACPLITFVTVNVLNSWQVSLSWDAPESNYDTRAEYKLSTETEWTLWADHIGGGGIFPGEPNTTYDFRVKQYCTNGYESDWAYTSFTTFAEVPFTESFEATSIPDHWQIYSGLLNDVMAGTAQLTPTTGYWRFDTINGVFDNHAFLNIYNSNRKHWLVMPQVEMEENCQLSFKLALTKYSGTLQPVDPTQQDDDRFVVLASTDGGSTWTILREWNNTGSPYVYNNIPPTGKDVAINLTEYQDANLMIAFYGESTVSGNGDNNLHIDNVSIDYIPPCAPPTNVTILQTRPHGFTASFTPGSPTQTPNWFYFYSTDPDSPLTWNSWVDSTTFVVDRPSGNFVIYPETTYYLWVLYFCEEDNEFHWSDPVTFTTPEACPAPTNLTITDVTPHGVEATFTPGGDWQTQWGYYYTTTNNPPPYFNSITIIPSAGYPEWLHALQPNTHYYFWVGIECEEGGTSTYVWGEPAEFTTPYACSTKVYAQDVETDDVQPHEVSLDWSNSPATADQWQVCYSYYDVIPPESYMSDYSVIVDEPYATIDGLFPDLDYHFWIRALCDYLDDTPEWGEWSDMITVHTEVSCFPPINVTVSNITSTSATISWDPNPNTTVPVEYYEVNIESDDWGDPYVDIVFEPYVEVDLDGWNEPGEDLPCTVYVHAYCGQEEGLSEASEIVGFIFTDKESLTVNDGQDTNENVPIYGYWCDKYSKSQFIIPAEDIVDMQYSEISWMTFYAEDDYINWGNAKFDVYMLELPYCQTEFEDATATFYDWDGLDLVYSQGSLSIDNGLMVVELDEPYYYTDGSLLIGFKQTVSGTYQNCLWYGVNQTGNTAIGGFEYSKGISFQQFLPKISFVYMPSEVTSCRRPSHFTAEVLDSQYVTYNWTPGSEDQTLWQIAFGLPEVFDINDASTWTNLLTFNTYPATNVNPNLYEPNTTYVACIRARCDNYNSFSSWSCPITFTMEETCPKPKNITVTDITTTEATINWVSQNNVWISMYRTDYEDAYDFETNTLEGWTSEGSGTWTVGTGDYQIETGAHSGNYNAKIIHAASGNETWLISPMMNLTGNHVIYADFWFINRKWVNDIDELGLYYRVDGGEWNELWYTTEAHETWTRLRVNLGLIYDNYQIGFKMTDRYGYGVGLDDIRIIGQKFAGQHNVNYPNQSITLTNLQPDTEYDFYMGADCGGTQSSTTGWISFTTQEVTTLTQDVALATGSNYVSFYVETTLDDLKAALLATGNTSISIKSKNQNTYYQGGRWRGNLTWDVAKMYIIQVGNACEIALEGMPMDPAEHPITIVNGSTYIGFPLIEDMSLTNAFAGFAVNGDKIQSKTGSAQYTGGRWRGTSLTTLEPGKGYIYKSSQTGNRTLVFPSSNK